MTLAAAGRRGAVATGHPVATAVGASVLDQGGSAADAVVAVAATLWVVQPNQSGAGGDAFAVVRKGDEEPMAMVGSGPAPAAVDAERLRRDGDGIRLPRHGMQSVSVPGEVDLLRQVHERWGSGRFTWEDLVHPAAERADEGVVVSRPLARWIAESQRLLSSDPETAAIYLPGGRRPVAGDILRQDRLASSLAKLAIDGPRALYEGKLASALVEACTVRGGVLTLDDLRRYRAELVRPLSMEWQGCRVHVPPPPSQAIMILEVLGMMAGDDLTDPEDPRCIHLLAEAHKCAVDDRIDYLGDPAYVMRDPAALLDKDYLVRRRRQLGERATDVVTSSRSRSNTTSFSLADRAGLQISYVTSLSNSFGCGIVAGETGLLLNNRAGRGFNLDVGSPNFLEPGKRSMHTLCPALLVDGPETLLLNTPGGDRQAQWMVQAIVAYRSASNPRENLYDICNGPRWHVSPGTDPHNWGKPTELHVEAGFPPGTLKELAARGHRIVPRGDQGGGGGLQAVLGRHGCWWAASDARVDGAAVAL